MAEVDILLASYNGEKFIAEQIESLLGQTFKDIRIIIRDDGSTDRTPEIIEQYAEKYPGIIKIIHDDAICKDPSKNFFQLMKYAEAEYIMFCDQDDYWLKYKVQITLDYMKKTERENPGLPVLVFCGLDVVDENLQRMEHLLNVDIKRISLNTGNLLFSESKAFGCTEMLNRTAYKKLGEFSDIMKIYDYWISLYASACGAICHIPMPLILYRQHSGNYSNHDADTLAKHIKIIISKPLKKFYLAREHFFNMHKRFELLLEMYSDMMTDEKKQEIYNFLEIFSKNRITRFKTYRRLFNINEDSMLSQCLHNQFSKLLFILKLILY